MKVCMPHWNALRDAVELRGLGYLIAANGRDAHARAVAELQGKGDVSDFDPLMSAHWMIVSRATQVLGLGILSPNPDDPVGNYCPVCELLKVTPPPPEGHRYPTNEAYFIDGPADAVLAMAIDAGLYPPSTPHREGAP